MPSGSRMALFTRRTRGVSLAAGQIGLADTIRAAVRVYEALDARMSGRFTYGQGLGTSRACRACPATGVATRAVGHSSRTIAPGQAIDAGMSGWIANLVLAVSGCETFHTCPGRGVAKLPVLAARAARGRTACATLSARIPSRPGSGPPAA